MCEQFKAGVTSSSPPAAAAVTPAQDLRWLTLAEELIECRREVRGVLLGCDNFSHLPAFPETHILVNDALGGLRKALVCMDMAISVTLRKRPVE